MGDATTLPPEPFVGDGSRLTDPKKAVELSTYEWHELLALMEYQFQIVNRDHTVMKRLYEAIASQLNGRPVIVNLIRPEPKLPPNKVCTCSVLDYVCRTVNKDCPIHSPK